MMNRLRSLLLILVCLLLSQVVYAESDKDKPLNILVLFADDWRHDTLGVAGNPIVLTPHLDKLAGQGIRFTNNYVTSSVCSVSRASLYTGQWMSRHGCRAFNAWQTPTINVNRMIFL